MIKCIFERIASCFFKIKHKFIRFLFVGFLNTCFGYGSFLFFIWIGAHETWAVFFSLLLSLFFNYKTTGFFVFENRSNRLILRFLLVYAVIYVCNITELYFLGKTGIYEYILGLRLFAWVHSSSIDLHKAGVSIGQALFLIPNALLGFTLNRVFVFPRIKDSSKAK